MRPKGWKFESARHSLAAKGVKTGRSMRRKQFMTEFSKELKATEQSTRERLLNDPSAIETYEHEGKVIQIFHEEDPESPREWDNLGHVLAFHSSYDLGDKDQTEKSEDFKGWDDVAEYLFKEKNAVVVFPVYLYDHSGLRMKIGSFAGLLPQGHAEFDSGQVGFIYATKADLKREGLTKKRAAEVLRGEIQTYDQYLAGDIYGYNVTDPKRPAKSDGCWGFYGIKNVKEAAEESARGL